MNPTLSLQYFSDRQFIFKLFVLPFLSIYSILILFYCSPFIPGNNLFIISFILTSVIHLLIFLISQWSLKFYCYLCYRKNTDIMTTHYIYVKPQKHNGIEEICKLNKFYPKNKDEQIELHFFFQKIKYLYDFSTKEFKPLPYPISLPISHYLNSNGIETKEDLEKLNKKYGKNEFKIPLVTKSKLMYENCMAPFFLFQIFCELLWSLNGYWHYCLFTLFMLFSIEFGMTIKRYNDLKSIRKMRVSSFPVYVYRERKWIKILSKDILPNDIISVSNAISDICPCDIFLLNGNVVVNESLLTGESTAQIKEGVMKCELNSKDILNIQNTHKFSMLSSGTILMQINIDENNTYLTLPPDNGAIGYVLQTGFRTNQGKLLSTILYSTQRVTVNNKEAFIFMLFLLFFALIAVVYMIYYGLQMENIDIYELILMCILIITTVIPPELPMVLSIAINGSIVELKKKDIYCTEGFRIPNAGKLKYCFFDKTGTLTEDKILFRGIIYEESDIILKLRDISVLSKYILSGCHSLSMINSILMGDPLEISAFKFIKCSLINNHHVSSDDGLFSIRILKRFPFNSTRRRMSCLIQIKNNRGKKIIMIVTKGAPEAMLSLFKEEPNNYFNILGNYSKQGYRILSLGYRFIHGISSSEIKGISLIESEKDLKFAGFSIFSSPIKKETTETIINLRTSNHFVRIMTGDHLYITCFVAEKILVCIRPIIYLDEVKDKENEYVWKRVKNDMIVDELSCRSNIESLKKLNDKFDLCISGESLDNISKDKKYDLLIVRYLVKNVKLFVRMTPIQKEYVHKILKKEGNITFMCGDGTNDVGALKQAHIGVAIFNSGNHDIKEENKNKFKKNKSKNNQIIKDENNELINLNYASVASPFTTKNESIKCAIDIIKEGRKTLVITLQMYRILALNCLISAYCYSVLYLKGVKISDTQAMLEGFTVAILFTCLSYSKPLKKLSSQKPYDSVFRLYPLISIVGQFLIHFLMILLILFICNNYNGTDNLLLNTNVPNKDEFMPNLLNTLIYILSIVMIITNFFVNYTGPPFMNKIIENKKLVRVMLLNLCVIIICVFNVYPSLNFYIDLVPITDESLRYKVIMVLVGDFVIAYFYEKFLRLIFRGVVEDSKEFDMGGVIDDKRKE